MKPQVLFPCLDTYYVMCVWAKLVMVYPSIYSVIIGAFVNPLSKDLTFVDENFMKVFSLRKSVCK